MYDGITFFDNTLSRYHERVNRFNQTLKDLSLTLHYTTNEKKKTLRHALVANQTFAVQMKHYCAKPSGFNDWRSDIVAENK